MRKQATNTLKIAPMSAPSATPVPTASPATAVETQRRRGLLSSRQAKAKKEPPGAEGESEKPQGDPQFGKRYGPEESKQEVRRAGEPGDCPGTDGIEILPGS